MFLVECFDASEIRMGSPYNVCRIRLTGEWVPDLPCTDWQDIFSIRGDRKAVALVRWDVPGNVPGFRIWIIDAIKEAVTISDRFQGCCQMVEWRSPTSIYWEAFSDLTGLYVLE